MRKILVTDNLEILSGSDTTSSDVYYTRDIENISNTIESFCEDGYSEIFVTENIASKIDSDASSVRVKIMRKQGT